MLIMDLLNHQTMVLLGIMQLYQELYMELHRLLMVNMLLLYIKMGLFQKYLYLLIMVLILQIH